MHRLKAYLELTRFPAVFTALADIGLGFLLNHVDLSPSPGQPDPRIQLALLCLCSGCLYLAGMVFNDVFDRRVDAEQRSQRPIPSGRVSCRTAVGLGGMLFLLGTWAAWLVGAASLELALMLIACIMAYDGGLKRLPVVGPLAMGGCRMLNVMLGASAAGGLFLWARPQLPVAIGLGVYVAGLTWFGRTEARTSQRSQLLLAALLVNAGIVWLAYLPFVYLTGPKQVDNLQVVLALAVIGLIINRRLLFAILTPDAAHVQVAVKTMLLSLVILDGTLVYCKTGEPLLAAAVVALLVPSLLLSRWLYVT